MATPFAGAGIWRPSSSCYSIVKWRPGASNALSTIPGCLTQTHRRCRRPTCHCAAEGDPGHPIWFLTFLSGGKRRVERIPADWAEEVARQVKAGQAFQDANKDMLAANAELLVLWRKQMGM